MIVKEEFLSRLRRYFGLNLYEVKIWTALLSRGIAAASQLAEISGVPRSRCYDVLESLEKKGFIITEDPMDADVAIVNTCGFVQDAKEESIDAILRLVDLKKEGKIKKLGTVTLNSPKPTKEYESPILMQRENALRSSINDWKISYRRRERINRSDLEA